MESVYEACLSYELTGRGIAHQCQAVLPVVYKGAELECGYRLDLLIEDSLIVELKTVDAILPVHRAQLLTYLKVKGCWAGLLLNFNEATLKDGIIRIVNGYMKDK